MANRTEGGVAEGAGSPVESPQASRASRARMPIEAADRYLNIFNDAFRGTMVCLWDRTSNQTTGPVGS